MLNKFLYCTFTVLFFAWISFLLLVAGSFLIDVYFEEPNFYEVWLSITRTINPFNTNIGIISIFCFMFAIVLKMLSNYYEKKSYSDQTDKIL